MNLYLQLYLGLILLLCATVMGIGLLVFFYFKLLKRYWKLQQEELLKEESINERSLELLKKAQEDYQIKIKEAKEDAKEIVDQANKEKKDTEEMLLDTLKDLDENELKLIKETSRNLLKKYGLSLKIEKIGNINLRNNISKSIEEYKKTENKKLEEEVLKEEIQSQKLLEEAIEKSHDSIEKGLEEYKKKKLEDVDTNIQKIVMNTVKLTIGKSISTKEHEKLVLKALEEAKKEGKL